ncbi:MULTISPECIES: hypothetical protein [Sphingobium]|jgi:hypothetical protein|uniref:Uncharacterized protein n=2 Tax=Sphingobium yanoikuyae TaxID=13690 RepID=K9CTY1_SPHYA|nr:MULTISPECIES: hypothetical protein [Sphingobium]ATI81288.1 hypothetical protein A6768_15670 [Sphingobium yanoikuyae]ATP20741.1 hypothetical protein BV87_21730 [Sphingobium yanoikuyae]AYO78153.1 hypothetical protein EBF16_15440 [Sphingobium yanoikuyae]EKU75704.1 hypothetical protein HMPREF9718_01056 [Sphingobium yanoikuyae ATCC 51230]KEZ20864.1 Hypothetical protein precursor [Sphingobium yanoikuyae]
MAQILTAIYLLMMLAGGWRLFGLGWPLWVKGLVAIGLVCPLPLLVLLPGMLHPERPFADMLRMIGFVMMGCGALCLVGGLSAARLRARRR